MNKNYDEIVKRSKDIFVKWRSIPAPQRGEYIRKFGEELRAKKDYLAETITKEARKIQTESQGEVQEAIDMCDFAVGLSRQLYGFTMPSERPNHRLQELWHPLGVVGCITAFNFPMAVFAVFHVASGSSWLSYKLRFTYDFLSVFTLLSLVPLSLLGKVA